MTDEQRSPDDYPPFLRSLAELVERLGKKIELLSDESRKTDEQQKETDKQLKELGRRMAESSAESKRESAELHQRMTDSLAKASAESKRESAELSRKMAEGWQEIRQQSGAVDRRFGKLAEAMTLGDVLDLLNSHRQINVHSLRHNDEGIYKGNQYEIDAFAYGDDCVVVLEAKATLRAGHIGDFVGKSLNLRKFFDLHPEHRGKKLYGAVAYLKIDDKAKELANKKGLLIIKSTHSNKTLVNPKIKLRDYTTKNNR